MIDITKIGYGKNGIITWISSFCNMIDINEQK